MQDFGFECKTLGAAYFLTDASVPTMTTQPPLDAVQSALHARQQQWLVAFGQGDIARVAAIYAQSGQLLPAYSAAICGRGAIQAFWQGCWDMGICAIQRTPLEIDYLATTVNEVGEYRVLDRHKRVLDLGKYVVIWKALRGEWAIHREIWTSNLLPAR